MNDILLQWKSQNKLSEESNFIYGNYNKVGFAVNYENSGYLFVLTLESDSDASFKSLQNKISAQGNKFDGLQVGKVESYLALFIQSVSVPNDLSAIIDFAVRNSSECGFYTPKVCSSCGAVATKMKFENGVVRPVCADCKAGIVKTPEPEVKKEEDYLSSLQDDSYESEEYVIGKNKDNIAAFYGDSKSDDSFNSEEWSKHDDFVIEGTDEYYQILDDDEFDYGTSGMSRGNVFLGILGALLGAAIGVIPYFLLYKFLDIPVAALCLVSGILSVLMYTWFRGRKSVGLGMTLSLVFSIVAAVGMVVFIQNTVEISNGGVSIFTDITGLFGNTAFLIHVLMAVVGAILGAFVCKGALNNYCE